MFTKRLKNSCLLINFKSVPQKISWCTKHVLYRTEVKFFNNALMFILSFNVRYISIATESKILLSFVKVHFPASAVYCNIDSAFSQPLTGAPCKGCQRCAKVFSYTSVYTLCYVTNSLRTHSARLWIRIVSLLE